MWFYSLLLDILVFKYVLLLASSGIRMAHFIFFTLIIISVCNIMQIINRHNPAWLTIFDGNVLFCGPSRRPCVMCPQTPPRVCVRIHHRVCLCCLMDAVYCVYMRQMHVYTPRFIHKIFSFSLYWQTFMPLDSEGKGSQCRARFGVTSVGLGWGSQCRAKFGGHTCRARFGDHRCGANLGVTSVRLG